MNIQCPKCGQSLEGDVALGTPVSCPSCGADFTVSRTAPAPRKGSLVRGIVGAALGAFTGALLWALVGMLGYIAAIVGFAIAWLVTFGYDHAGGTQGLPRVAVVFLAMVASVVLGNAFQVEWQLRDAWRQHRAKLDETVEMLFREAPDLAALEGEAREEALEGMRAGVEGITYGEFRSEVLHDPDVRRDLLKNLGMGLVFAFLGGFGFLRKKKTEEA